MMNAEILICILLLVGSSKGLGDNRCRFMPGDGIGGSNIKIGRQKGSQCIDACLARKKVDPSINGVTVPTNNDGSCWCEKDMKGRNGNTWWKSCFIGETGLDGDLRCTFFPGDGSGGSEFKIGSEKGSQCIDACLERKKTDDSINGVTVPANNKDGCWCERNMLSRNKKTSWKSCFIGNTGIKGDTRCTFYSGDGIGGTEIKVGMQTGSQCIDACLARKKKDDSINGVTLTATDKPGCWCERKMSGRNENAFYKSCFIGDTGVISSCQIKVLSVDHSSGRTGMYFNFNMPRLAVLKPNQTITFKATNYRSRLSGEVIVWGASNGGSLGNAHGRFNNNPIPFKLGQWRVGDTVIPKDEALCKSGMTSSCQIKVLSVDHSSGKTGMYFNFNMPRLAVLKPGETITFKATNYRSRLSGEVIVWGGSNGGSLGNAHGRFNNNPIPAKLGQWKVGDTVILQNETLCKSGIERSFGGICHRNFRKIGCFNRNWDLMTDLLITDLDPTHKNHTTNVDWDNYANSIHSLACRCQEKAKGNYKYFAIGFHAECLASKDTVGLEKIFEHMKQSGEGCINGEFSKCDKTHEAECAGAADFDYFYEIIN